MNCPFSISFVLTFMHRMGGIGGPCSSQSRLPMPYPLSFHTLLPRADARGSHDCTDKRSHPLCFQILPNSFALFCIFLHSRKTQLFSFQAIPNSFAKTPGVWGGAATLARSELLGVAVQKHRFPFCHPGLENRRFDPVKRCFAYSSAGRGSPFTGHSSLPKTGQCRLRHMVRDIYCSCRRVRTV
jgi:hypothetical protein